MADAGDADRNADFFEVYTRGLRSEDVQRLFTRDAPNALQFFTRQIDERAFRDLPPLRRLALRARLVFLAFTLKLSPARRLLFGVALAAALAGLLQLFEGFGIVRIPLVPFLVTIGLPGPLWSDGSLWLLLGFGLLNLLVLLEVADRLTLKNDLEVARDIQLAMLPQRTFATPGVEAAGRTRPANTVGGDCYDILPLADGRVLVALADVSGKGSPAALLMALLLAMLRTLAAEDLPPVGLVTRLNRLVHDHTPGSRFITLCFAMIDPRTGACEYVNAGQTPPLLRRTDGRYERLTTGGMALGMFPGATYESARCDLGIGDLLLLYSDGVTEAEDPAGQPLDEAGLRRILDTHAGAGVDELGGQVVREVERYTDRASFADDLTVLAVRRLPLPAGAPQASAP